MARIRVNQSFAFPVGDTTRTLVRGVHELDDVTAKAALDSEQGKHLVKHGLLANLDAPKGVTRVEKRTEAPKTRKSTSKAKSDPAEDDN